MRSWPLSSTLGAAFAVLLLANEYPWSQTMAAAFHYQLLPTRAATTRIVPSFRCAEPLEAENDANDFSLEAFQRVRAMNEVTTEAVEQTEDEFDGYDLRDIILAKWGQCFDVEFQKVDTMGFRKVYLNIMPFYLGRRPFRHATEYDYLCHLQAVVEILQQYDQLSYVLYQIDETKKRPLPGRSPIVAVPCRLDLTEEQVNAILG